MNNYVGFDSLPERLKVGDSIRVNFTGKVERWNPYLNKASKIKIECFGASGYSRTDNNRGYGGYASGVLKNINADLYITVGEEGKSNASNKVFGGGGKYGGGGATWVSKISTPTVKDDLYIVAAGGGSESPQSSETGGHGGGLEGEWGDFYDNRNERQGSVGTQTKGGELGGNSIYYGGFLFGGDGYNSTDWSGGGSGLYGGAGYWAGGSGGSSYVDGVEDGETYPGSNEKYRNKGNGYIIITVLEILSSIELIDIKEFYETSEEIKFGVKFIDGPKLKIKFNERVIKEITNLELNREYTFFIPKDLFLINANGKIKILFCIYESDDLKAIFEESIIKKSEKMIIITNPEVMQTYNIALDINLDIKYYTDIKIEVCNNGFDEEPTWEDNTNRILKGLNVLLENREKSDINWGLAFKITVTGEFEMGELIVGGFYESL